MRYLSAEESRNVDWLAKSQGHIPGILLMENAGRGIADILLAEKPKGKVLICCGRGNNGGDGFVIARHLNAAGVDVQVLLFADSKELMGDACINHAIITHSDIPLKVLISPSSDDLKSLFNEAEWIVDALVGTGQKGALRTPFDNVVRRINESGAKVLAVDLPSGLDADTGIANDPTIKATITATMVAPKKGFQNPEAQAYLGKLKVVGIGLPKWLMPPS
ncbi:MAG: NAD(P)H-hydrate epimerase [Gemmataceae bacterium]